MTPDVVVDAASSGCSSSGQSTGLRSREHRAGTTAAARRLQASGLALSDDPIAGTVSQWGYVRLGRNRQKQGPKQKCTVDGCTNARDYRELCDGHQQQARAGKPIKPLYHKRAPRVPFPHPTIPGACLVPLTRGEYAIVDAGVADLLVPFKWYLTIGPYGKKYAMAKWGFDERTAIGLHRFLWERWGLGDPEDLDHRDGNGLDCRRRNLRAATHLQNARNAKRSSRNESGWKGVNRRANGMFRARIRVDGKLIALGQFATGEEAHAAYVAAAREHFGEFARAA